MRVRFQHRNPNSSPQIVEDLAGALRCTPALAQLLISRGIDCAEQAKEFLSPGLHQLHDPMGLSGMAEAVARIQKALDAKERICIYGDYDVDGGAATAVVLSYLWPVGADAFYYIPHRHDEGYGLNIPAVECIHEKGATLLITVDCGITSAAEVAHAKSLGMDVIVTDHHQPLDELPDCITIDPKLPHQHYPYLELCGAGVAGKLVQALGGIDALVSRLDLVALATVADVVPLTGENRAIVSLGLERIRQGQCALGILRLCEAAGVDSNTLSATQIAFGLAPRINAGGRMGDPSRGVRLLLSKDRQEADALSQELNRENQTRRDVEAAILDQAVQQVTRMDDFPSNRVLVLVGEGWNEGVIGIVASRLVERYGRPTILLSQNEEGRLTGSGRSIPALSLIDALRECHDLMLRYGGHRQAAGLTMERRYLSEFKKRLSDAVNQRISPEDLIPTHTYDIEVPLSSVDLALARELKQLEPFGEANPPPILRLCGEAQEVRTMGKDGSHLRLTLADTDARASLVAFRMADEAQRLSTGTMVDALVELDENVWQGRSSAQCRVVAITPKQGAELPKSWFENEQEKVLRAFLDYIRYNMNNMEPFLNGEVCILPDAGAKLRALESLLSRGVEGTLMVVHSLQALSKLKEDIASLGLSSGVTFYEGQVLGDERRFHSAVIAPRFEGEWHRGWQDILFYDGLPLSGMGASLYTHTGARIWLNTGEGSRAFWQAYAPSFLQQLSREVLGELYRALRSMDGQRFMLESKLAAALHCSEWQLHAALAIFEELGFLQAGAAAEGRVAFVPQPAPRELNQSPFYARTQEVTSQIIQGGSNGP